MNLNFEYNGEIIEIVNVFSYLGIVFTAGGSFNQTQITLAFFKLNKYLFNFTNISIKHRLELFDKLVLPILNYGCEVWGFHMANNIERVHTQYCKNILSVKRSTQNNLCMESLVDFHCLLVNYWFKIIESQDHKYVNIVSKTLRSDIEVFLNKKNWASLLRDILSSLGVCMDLSRCWK